MTWLPIIRKLAPMLAVLAILAALLWWADGKGHDRAMREVREAIEESETATKEAVDNAPTFDVDDNHDARSLLCRIAGITDCALPSDGSEQDSPRARPH